MTNFWFVTAMLSRPFSSNDEYCDGCNGDEYIHLLKIS